MEQIIVMVLLGETRVRTQTHEHAAADKESCIFKNSQIKNIMVSDDDFKTPKVYCIDRKDYGSIVYQVI